MKPNFRLHRSPDPEDASCEVVCECVHPLTGELLRLELPLPHSHKAFVLNSFIEAVYDSGRQDGSNELRNQLFQLCKERGWT